jgi:hypothetical protein
MMTTKFISAMVVKYGGTRHLSPPLTSILKFLYGHNLGRNKKLSLFCFRGAESELKVYHLTALYLHGPQQR